MENTVTISRNDAAFMEVAKQYFLTEKAFSDIQAEYAAFDVMTLSNDKKSEFNRQAQQLGEQRRKLSALAHDYLRGEEIILAKLAQQ